MSKPNPERELEWIILSDAELTRRAQRLTVLGVAAVLVLSLLTIFAMRSGPEASSLSAHRGPVHIAVPSAKRTSGSDAPAKTAASGVSEAPSGRKKTRTLPPNPFVAPRVADNKRVRPPAGGIISDL